MNQKIRTGKTIKVDFNLIKIHRNKKYIKKYDFENKKKALKCSFSSKFLPFTQKVSK
jgi:predicted thioesterase